MGITVSDGLFAVLYRTPEDRTRAVALARELGVELLLGVEPAALSEPAFVLLCDRQGLALQQTGRPAPGPVRVDFVGGAAAHRRRFGGGRGQLIAKAAGVKAGVYPQVLDATAGLGKDAFVLATLGCQVRMLERSLLVHALLDDGLRYARGQAREFDPVLQTILARMDLMLGDGCDYLRQMAAGEQPDVIYLDPMFPERHKSALVKKEMAAFHRLVGGDDDASELLALALEKARYRVLVKRPRKAPELPGPAPSLHLAGKSSRFDIYSLRRLPDKLSSGIKR